MTDDLAKADGLAVSDTRCVRCDSPVVDADEWTWICPTHGTVVPLLPPHPLEHGEIETVASQSRVPLWIPWPLPAGWMITGVRCAGSPLEPARGVVIAASGPGVVSRADLVIVAEEPGIGLGARFAGLAGTDPGPEVTRLPADVTIHADGRAAVLWSVPGVSDRAAYVGEAAGLWLWLVVWPVTEWMVVHDDLRVVDLRRRHDGADLSAVELPFGNPTPLVAQLPPPPVQGY